MDTTSIGYVGPVEERTEPRSAPARIGRRLSVALLLSLAIGSLLLAVPPLHGVARQIEHMHLGWVVAAAGLELASCLGFVVIFRLFFDELPAGPARELAWTEEGSGALLPGGGVGALAIGGWLLRRAGMSTRSVIDRSSALFFLTSAVNVAALVGGAALFAVSRPDGADELLRVGTADPRRRRRGARCARRPDRDQPAPGPRLADLADRSRRRDRPRPSLALAAELAPARRARLPRLRHRGPGRDVRRGRPADRRRAADPRLPDRISREPDSDSGRVRRAGRRSGRHADRLRRAGHPGHRRRGRLPRNRVLDPKSRWPRRVRPPAPASRRIRRAPFPDRHVFTFRPASSWPVGTRSRTKPDRDCWHSPTPYEKGAV